jgi:hypothetical protein
MNKLFLALCLCFAACLASCSEAKPPMTASVEYTVLYQGSTSNVQLDTEGSPPAQGYCYIAGSSDPAYPRVLSFNFQKGVKSDDITTYHYFSVQSLRMRPGTSVEILPCDGVSIDFKGVTQQASLVECGATANAKCAFTSVSYNEQQNTVNGSFTCGAFQTNGFVTMEITRGIFSLTNCSVR